MRRGFRWYSGSVPFESHETTATVAFWFGVWFVFLSGIGYLITYLIATIAR